MFGHTAESITASCLLPMAGQVISLIRRTLHVLLFSSAALAEQKKKKQKCAALQ
jgi:hypothetical protein